MLEITKKNWLQFFAEDGKEDDTHEDETHEDDDDDSEGTEGAEEGKESGKAGGKDTKKNEKSFNQAQVNKMMTREKNQGRNSVYKELGIDPKDSKAVAAIKAFIESQKTDEQKQAEKDAEAQSKAREAEQRAQVAEAKAEAMMLGVKTQYVDDVVTLALAKMTEDSDLKTIIGEFKTKYPVWFGESDKDDKDDKGKGKTGQKGTGSTVKNSDKSKKGDENKGLGARLAAQRKSGSKKSSYWGNK